MGAKRLLVVVGIVMVIAAAPAMTVVHAKAIEASSNGCPSGGGWDLWAVSDLLTALGMTDVPPSMDNNDDGLTCVRLQTLANGRKGWVGVTFVDNNVK